MNVNLCFNDFFKGKFIDYEKVEFKKKKFLSSYLMLVIK